MTNSSESAPSAEDPKGEDRVQDEREAEYMAYAEDRHQVLAKNAEKAGLTELAEKHRKTAGDKSTEASEGYRKELTHRDAWIDSVISVILEDLEDKLKGIDSNPDPTVKVFYAKEEHDTRIANPGFQEKLFEVLGVREIPYDVSRGKSPEEEWRSYVTELERISLKVGVRKTSEQPFDFKYIVHNREAWENVVKKQKQLEETAEKRGKAAFVRDDKGKPKE